MEKSELRELAIEFATVNYDGEVEEEKYKWPDELKDASGAISKSAYCLGVNDSRDGFQVIALEAHKKENSFLVLEMNHEGAEINMWIRYGHRDWENYGPKEDGYWD